MEIPLVSGLHIEVPEFFVPMRIQTWVTKGYEWDIRVGYWMFKIRIVNPLNKSWDIYIWSRPPSLHPPHGLGPQVAAPIPFYLQAIGSISEVQLRIC